MDNYMHSVGYTTTSLHRPREPSSTGEEDGPAAPKRSRTSSAKQSKQLANDSLVAHMTHAAVARDASLTDYLGRQFSSAAYPVFQENQPRGIPSFTSLHQGPDHLLHDYRASLDRLQYLSRDAERQIYLQGIGSRLIGGGAYPTTSHAFSAAGDTAQLLSGSLSGWPLAASSAALMQLQRTGIQAAAAANISEQSWLDQMQAQRSASFLRPTLTSLPSTTTTSQIMTMPTSDFRFGEEESVNTTADISSLEAREFPPKELPVIIALPEDRFKLSVHQVFLRHQIEAFEASEEDVSTHTRGRNKRIKLGQVGIRCRHCSHLPVAVKQKGSVYFPATLLGLYQAAQNMSATHLQCGLCTQAPMAVKRQFVTLMTTRAFGSGAGRPYWAQAAKKLGLVDSDDGIRFVPIVSSSASEDGDVDEEGDGSKEPTP